MKKIVIIEDSKQTVEILSEILKKEGYEVNIAYDGVEGYRIIKKTKPDLVLLDLLLPKVSGFDICFKISQDDEIRKTPIIILSTLANDKETFRKLKTYEIIKFMKKPYNIDELLAEIKKILK
ncbi:MAG: response regulator [Elusimicrobiales bacterium]|nr:response regulator [Elusimicrobiales bacterium]